MLLYIKIKNSVGDIIRHIKFKEGLNIITSNGKNNVGKSMLVRLISKLYGGESNVKYLFSINEVSKITKETDGIKIEWSFEIEGKTYTFNCDLSSPAIIIFEGEEISVSKYSSYISDLLGNVDKLIYEHFNIDEKFIRKSSKKPGFGDFFAFKSSTYTAIMIMKLLKPEIDFEDIEQYFSEVAKRNSYKNLRGKYHKSVIERINSNVDEKEKSLELTKLRSKRRRFGKIKSEQIDSEVLEVIEMLNIDKLRHKEIISFQNELVSNYNEIIADELDAINNRIHEIQSEISYVEMDKHDKFDYQIATEVNEYICGLDCELTQKYQEIQDHLYQQMSLTNEQIAEFTREIFETYVEESVSVDNRLIYGRKINEILETISFVQKVGGGDGIKDMNSCLLYAYILANSRLNIVALDSMQTSEIGDDNFKKMISKIIDIIGSKQYIIVTLSSQNVTDMKEIILQLDKGENSLFGVDY